MLIGFLSNQFGVDISDTESFKAAEVARTEFPRQLRELAKADLEVGGRQFASIHLSLIGNLCAEVKGLRRIVEMANGQISEFDQNVAILIARFKHIEQFTLTWPQQALEMLSQLRQQVANANAILSDIHEGFDENRCLHRATHDH